MANIYPDAIREEIMQTQANLRRHRPSMCKATIPRMSLVMISATLGPFGADRSAAEQTDDEDFFIKAMTRVLVAGRSSW